VLGWIGKPLETRKLPEMPRGRRWLIDERPPDPDSRTRGPGQGRDALRVNRNGNGSDSNETARQAQRRAAKPLVNGGAQAAALVADIAFRHRVQRFWPLGSHVGAHLLAELAVKHGCRDEIERWLDRTLERENTMRALGVDRWPPLPVRAVS
jgi:hypothetical protein